MKNITIKPVILASTALLGLGVQCQSEEKAADKPNILWLVSEDNCPYLGCYGDSYANSPNLPTTPRSLPRGISSGSTNTPVSRSHVCAGYQPASKPPHKRLRLPLRFFHATTPGNGLYTRRAGTHSAREMGFPTENLFPHIHQRLLFACYL